MRGYIISHTIYAVVHLSDRILVCSGLLVFNLSEADRRIFLRGNSRHGCRHRCIFRHCCQIEGKAVCLAPVLECLRDFDLCLCRLVGIGHDQAVRTVIIFCDCRQLIVIVLCDCNYDLVRCRIIGHAVHAVVHFGDRVLIRTGCVVFNFSKDCRRCILRSDRCRVRRHRSAFRHSCQIECEAVCLAPVVERLCSLQRRLRSRECVRDDQAVRAVILDFCRKGVRIIFCLRDCDDDLMRCRVISHTVHAVIHLSDRVLVLSGFLKCNLSKDCVNCILCRDRRRILRHRCACCHSCQIECKAVRFAPVIELLCRLDLRLCRCIRICNGQAVRIVVLDLSRQLISRVIGLCDRHHYPVRCRVIGHAVRAVVHLGDRVLVFSGLLVCNLAEDGCRVVLCCDCRRILRHRSVRCHSCQFECEAVCLAPVCEVLRRFDCCLCRFILICNGQAFLTVVCDLSTELIRLRVLRDRDDHFVCTCVIGHAVHAVIFFGDRVLVSSGRLIGDLTENCCRIRFCRVHFCIRRHRSTRRHSLQLECKAGCLAPVIKVFCRFDRCRRRRVCICNGQAVRTVILDLSTERVRIRIL